MTTVARIDDEAGFDALRMEWDELLARTPSPTVFRTWAWQHSWWRRFRGDRQLRIYAAREPGGRLTGLAPLCLEPPGAPFSGAALRFLGTERVSSEYLGVFLERGCDETTADMLLDAILRDGGWDALELTDLVEDDTWSSRWEGRLRTLGYAVDRASSQACPYLTLPRTLDELDRALSHSLRGSARRAARKLAEAGYRPRVETDPARIGAALDRLYELHASRWSARGRPGNFTDDRVRGFHQDLAALLGAQGVLRIHSLAAQDRVIAMLYALEWEGVVLYYQSGYEPTSPDPALKPGDYSPGTVLIHAALEDAIGRGMREFDFLRGLEPYKTRWAPSVRRTWTLAAIRPGAWGARSRHRLRRWARWSKRGVKRLLARGPRDA
jgi:CelD/BcsL family acetyltransferase involved in cellulose biosynthesis